MYKVATPYEYYNTHTNVKRIAPSLRRPTNLAYENALNRVERDLQHNQIIL